jgi:hypothetical protein|tara:strand:+ start:203 stop:433 length:231 start_codon:yes stop_codon:yes gene_type:complete
MVINEKIKERVLKKIETLSEIEKKVLESVKLDLMYDRVWCETHGIDYINVHIYSDDIRAHAYLEIYHDEICKNKLY